MSISGDSFRPETPYEAFWLSYLPEIAANIRRTYVTTRRERGDHDYPDDGIPADEVFWEKLALGVVQTGRDFGELWHRVLSNCEPTPWPSSLLTDAKLEIDRDAYWYPRDTTDLDYCIRRLAAALARSTSMEKPSLFKICESAEFECDPLSSTFLWMAALAYGDEQLRHKVQPKAILIHMWTRAGFDQFWKKYPFEMYSCFKPNVYPVPSPTNKCFWDDVFNQAKQIVCSQRR